VKKRTEIGRGKYYLDHYMRDVYDWTYITKSNAKVGMVCQIEYRADYRRNRKPSLYLIIAFHAGLIHTIDLDYVNPNTFKKFSLLSENRTDSLKLKGTDFFYFPFTVFGEKLYANFVNEILDEQAYRRLKPTKIRSLRLCAMKTMKEKFKDTNKDTDSNSKEDNK